MNRDIQLPEGYVQYFQDYGRCKNCCSPLRHFLHAFNHFKKYHYEEKPRYFVFGHGMWLECTLTVCIKAMKDKRCWAVTKPGQKRKES